MTAPQLRLALTVLAGVAFGCRPVAPPTTTPVVPPTATPPARPADYARPLPAGAAALRKLTPAEYPDFAPAAAAFNVPAVRAAIGQSLAYLGTPAGRSAYPYLDVSHDRAVGTLTALRDLLGTDPVDGRAFDAAIRARFDVYQSVGAVDDDGRATGRVLFTGYCTPIYPASRTRVGPYQWPLYERPADWVKLPGAGDDRVGRRRADGSVEPGYPSRREIERGNLLAGDELAYLASQVDAYVVTVQGSARLRLPDGSLLDVGNDGTNGRPYTSPGKRMVADGVLPAERLNLSGLRAYFAAHPDAADNYLLRNDRTAFFALRPGGPFGKLGVPVTPYATIATDKSIFPRGLPALVCGDLAVPSGTLPAFSGLMLDQDAGGAIRSAGRCDIYTGVGPAAEQAAGREGAVGRLYYLALRRASTPP